MKVAGFPGMAGGFLLDERLPIHCARTQRMGNLRLEDFVVADGHAWWSFEGLGGDEFCGIALELVDAFDERGSVDGFGRVSGYWGSGELLE